MSFEHVAIAMNHTRSSRAVRAVIIGIASHANEDGEAYPGMMKLAQYGGYDGWDALPENDAKEARDAARTARDSARRAARRAVQQLQDLGEIEVTANGGGTRNRPEHMRPNLYKVTLTCPPNCDHSAQHRLLTPAETIAKLRRQLGLPDGPVDNSESDPGAGETPRGESAPTPGAGETPESSTNHNLENSEPKSNNQSVTARENEEDIQPVDDYTNWHPGQQIAKTAAVVNSGGIFTEAEAKKFTDLVDGPPPPTKTPPHPEPVSAEQQALNDAAEKLPCPKGFGSGKFTRHWIPGITSCATCGEEAATILDRVQQLEVTP